MLNIKHQVNADAAVTVAVTVTVQVPALDRLVDYLTAGQQQQQQQQIDAATARIGELVGRLEQANAGLGKVVGQANEQTMQATQATQANK